MIGYEALESSSHFPVLFLMGYYMLILVKGRFVKAVLKLGTNVFADMYN